MIFTDTLVEIKAGVKQLLLRVGLTSHHSNNSPLLLIYFHFNEDNVYNQVLFGQQPVVI
jgi:hypothetical protein